MNKKEKLILQKIEESVKSNGDYSKLSSNIQINVEPKEIKAKKSYSKGLIFSGLVASLMIVIIIALPIALKSDNDLSHNKGNDAIQNGSSFESDTAVDEEPNTESQTSSEAVSSIPALSESTNCTEVDSSAAGPEGDNNTASPAPVVIEYDGNFYELKAISVGDGGFDGDLIYLAEVDGYYIYLYGEDLIAIDIATNEKFFMKVR